MTHTVSILLANEPGALARVVELFAKRNYNIDNLTVAPTASTNLSKITLSVSCSQDTLGKIVKQLDNIIPVAEVRQVISSTHIIKELTFIKIKFKDKLNTAKIKQLLSGYAGQIIETMAAYCIVELIGNKQQLSAFLSNLDKDSIIECTSSGLVSILHDDKP